MTRVLLILAVLMAGGPAVALSCLRPDVVRSFQYAQEAEEAFVVVKGVLQFDERLMPERDLTDNSAEDAEIEARLTGVALSKAGFGTPFDKDVTLRLLCFGPWCGGVSPGVEYLMFVELRDGQYVINVDPCGSSAFERPSAEQIGAVESCMAGRACTPKTKPY